MIALAGFVGLTMATAAVSRGRRRAACVALVGAVVCFVGWIPFVAPLGNRFGI